MTTTASDRTRKVPNGRHPHPLLVYFGHHKCASGWTTSIFREICYHMGCDFGIVHRPNDLEDTSSLGEYVHTKDVDFLAYTNADYQQLDGLPAWKGFHVVRDPRDILVSAYYSHLRTHDTDDWPELAAHREKLQGLSKKEGLFREMEFSAWVFEHMEQWDYDQDDVLELKMEELTAAPVEGFMEIADFLDILGSAPDGDDSDLLRTVQIRLNRLNQKGRRFTPGKLPLFPVPRRRINAIPRREIERIVDRYRFSKLTGGRKPGEENRDSHLRKGKPGDWENHFTDEHVRAFKNRYNELLVELGYETDTDWA